MNIENKIRATTRKTKHGHFQPVLIVVETGQRYTPGDWSEPSLDRKTAKKYADLFKMNAMETGTIPQMQ